jgi:hypothetical protein
VLDISLVPLPAMVQLITVTVEDKLYIPAPFSAVLLLMMQLMNLGLELEL